CRWRRRGWRAERSPPAPSATAGAAVVPSRTARSPPRTRSRRTPACPSPPPNPSLASPSPPLRRPLGLQTLERDLRVVGERHDRPVLRRQPLPLEREQSMPLQVAERAVIAEDVEPVCRSLERASRPMSPIRPLADVRLEDGPALALRHLLRDLEQSIIRNVRDGVERRR